METLKNEGNIFFNDKKYNEALEKYLLALSKCNEDINNLTQMDQIIDDSDTEDEEEEDSLEPKDTTKDVEPISNLLEKLKNEKSILNSNISVTYCNLKNYNKAIEHAVDSTKLRPKWYKSWFRLSDVLYQLEKYEQSITSIDKSIECLNNEQDKSNDFLIKLNILNDYKDKIQNKLEKKNRVEKNKEKLDDAFKDIFSDEEINKKINSKEFEDKLKNFNNNPLELAKDPDMMNIMNKMMGKVDKNKIEDIISNFK